MDKVFYLKGASSSVYLERTKFLLLNLIDCEREPTIDEQIEMTYLLDRLFDEADIGFIRRYKFLVGEIQESYKAFLNPRFTPEENAHMAKRILEVRDSELKIHNAYFGRLKQNPTKSLLGSRPVRRAPRPVRKRFIGVGYKDHGTMKNIAKDGSPHWKEVSSHFTNTESPPKKFKYFWWMSHWKKFKRVFERIIEYEESDN